MSINRTEHSQKVITVEEQMIDFRPQDQNVWDRDQGFMRPRPRPVTVRPRPRPKKWFGDHAGLEILTSLLSTWTFTAVKFGCFLRVHCVVVAIPIVVLDFN